MTLRALTVALIVAAAGCGVLLQFGADVHVSGRKGETVLHVGVAATYRPSVERYALFDLLAAAGADPNARNKSGQTPRDLMKGRKRDWPRDYFEGAFKPRPPAQT
jgi:hypothetical protein